MHACVFIYLCKLICPILRSRRIRMKDKDGERKKEAESAGLEQVEQSFLQMFEGATLTWNLATYVLITHTDTHTRSFSHLFSSPCAFSLKHKQKDKTQWIFLPGTRKQYPDSFFLVLLSIYEFLRGAERFGVCMCVSALKMFLLEFEVYNS